MNVLLYDIIHILNLKLKILNMRITKDILLISLGVVIVLFFAILKFLGPQGIVESPAAPTLPSPAVSTPTGSWICIDTDQNAEENGIYIPGYVTHKQPNSGPVTVYDNCIGDTGLNEFWCYESPEGSGNQVVGRQALQCPGGCIGGACLKVSDFITHSTTLNYPYELFWHQNNASFIVTSINLEWIQARALTFSLIIEARRQNQPVAITLRRVVDETGSSVPPNTPSLFLPQSGGQILPEGTILYDNQKVIFFIPAGETEFLFSAGEENAKIYFIVQVLPNGTLKILKDEGQG